MFYKINKTQERIDPNLSFFLKAKIDPDSDEGFWCEVFTRLNKKGFFVDRFSFKEATLKRGDPKRGLISVVTYGGVLRLNKTYKRKGIVSEGLNVFYANDRKRDTNFAFNLLKNYFDIIELVLHNQKVKKDNLTPREIGALIRLLRHFVLTDKKWLEILGQAEDITKSQQKEHKDTVKHLERILKHIPFKDAIALDYPTSNWAAVEGYIFGKINKRRPTFGNKNLLSKKGLEIFKEI